MSNEQLKKAEAISKRSQMNLRTRAFWSGIILTKEWRCSIQRSEPKTTRHRNGYYGYPEVFRIRPTCKSHNGLRPSSYKKILRRCKCCLQITGKNRKPKFYGVDEVFKMDNVDLRLFSKPNASEGRRMAVVLTSGETAEESVELAKRARDFLEIRES